MDVVIHTSDPEAINTEEIQQALEGLGYFVLSVSIEGRIEEADLREGLPLILAMDDDYCPKSEDGTHQFGEDRSCDLCGEKEEA